jgi:peptidoglycan/xylan/chitin deacetylase (PgdA/CDA1 family)
LLPLRWNELEQLVAAGWEVGSHTVTHPRLTELADHDLETELVESRRAIMSRLGLCDTIAYPFGLADGRVAAAAARAGYLAGVTLSGAHREDEPHRRPRVGLYPGDEGLRMRAKLSTIGAATRRTALADMAERVRTRVGGGGSPR